MLVLNRKRGDSVALELPAGQAARVLISIHKVANGNVRLRFDAPSHVRILRTELESRTEHEATVDRIPE